MDKYKHLQPAPTSPKWRHLPGQRMQEMGDVLWNKEVLHVYTDASPAMQEKRVIGIAAAFAWDGNLVMRSRKHYERAPIPSANVLGEIVALLFALKEIPSVFRKEGFKPQRIKVMTDYNRVVDWLEDDDLVPPTEFTNFVSQIKTQMSQLQEDSNLSVVHLGDERHYNPFYKAVHRRSRQEVDIYSGRTGRHGR